MPSLALTMVLWLAMPQTAADNARAAAIADHMVAWYASVGVTITVESLTVRAVVPGSCPNAFAWWHLTPQAGTYLHIVDCDGVIYAQSEGVAFQDRGRRVAVVRYRAAAVDVIVAHEVGHLLGARDDLVGSDIMSADMDRAYAEHQLSQSSWTAMGGPAPTYTVMLPRMAQEAVYG
jgi:hypothetical protein